VANLAGIKEDYQIMGHNYDLYTMSMSQEIWEEFIKKYPQANSGKLSIEQINVLMAKYLEKRNASAVDDFDGLSPHQMHLLLLYPLAEDSPLKWVAPHYESDLAAIPLLALSDMLLAEIQKAGELRLTAKGNLPVAVCTLLVKKNLIYWKYMKYVKILSEDNIPYIWPIKEYLTTEGLIKKRNNKLSVTKKGEKYPKLAHSERLLQLLSFFTARFNWQNLYGIEDDGEIGSIGWAFSLYLFRKYGHETKNAQFYADKWIRAFHTQYWTERNNPAYNAIISDIRSAYEHRFFGCFAKWFGFVEVEEIQIPKQVISLMEVKKTETLEKCFGVR